MGNSTKVGDVQVTRVEESYGPTFPIDLMLAGFDANAAEAHGGPAAFAPHYDAASGMAYSSVHTWLVRTPRSTILIDTCCGNDKERPNMPMGHQLDLPFLDGLAAEGVRPEDVDLVVCTHLHIDHVGWNTMLVDGEWVPTFPNATYIFNRTDFEFWDPENPANDAHVFNAGVFHDSVRPVFDRERVQLWDDALDLDEVFTLETAPGHTPGHAICWLESKGERALFSGDVMHSAIQVFEPTLNSGFDVNPDEAKTSRRRVLDRCLDKDALLLPAHFSAPHAYRLRDRGLDIAPVPLS